MLSSSPMATGHAKEPPHKVTVDPGTPNAGMVDEVEDPNPRPGTNNWYTEDGYGGGSYGSASYGGGSYSNCADPTQPGVSAVVKYLQSLPHPVDPHCEVGHYYLSEQLQPRLLRSGRKRFRRRIPGQHRIYDSAVRHAQHWRRTSCQGHFVEVLRRPMERLCGCWQPQSAALHAANTHHGLLHPRGPVSTQLRSGGLAERSWRSYRQRRRVLQHLQPVPVRHVNHGQLLGSQSPRPGHA